ncbi:1,3-beta-glucanase, partial [Streptomyces sp. NPDC057052]
MSEPSGTPPRRRRSLRRALVAAVGTLGLAAAAAVASPSANASAPTPPSGWSQVFLDDFNGAAGTGVNTSAWQYATGTSYPG